MRKDKIIALLLCIILIVPIVVACSSGETEPAGLDEEIVENGDAGDELEESTEVDRYGGTFRISQQTATSSLDPAQYSTLSNYEIGIHMFETPVIADDFGYIWPGVCEYDLDEGCEWLKLTVRDGVTFHNGEKVDIHDVIASINRASNWASRLQEGFTEYLSETEIVDDMNVIFHFNKPAYNAAYMLGSLTNGAQVMPKEIIEPLGDEELITDDSLLIGTGPYKLKEWVRDNYIVIERYDGYTPTDADSTGFGGPKMAYFDEIKWTVVGDAVARTNGLMAGEYDVAGTLVADMREDIVNSGCQVLKTWKYWTPNIMFNLSDARAKSPIADPKLRKAIRTVIDFDALLLANDRLPDEYKTDPTMVMDGSPYYNDILKEGYNVKDQELAKKYLEESSYNGEDIVIICSESASFYKTALPLSQMMKDIGINVDLQIIDSSSYSSYRTDKENYSNAWDICLLENQKQFNPMSLVVWLGGEDTPVGWWGNKDIEPLKQIMRTSPIASEESIGAFEEFCNIIMEDTPYILVGEFCTVSFARDNVVIDSEGPVSYYWNSWFNE